MRGTQLSAPPVLASPRLNPLAVPALGAAYFMLGLSVNAPIGLVSPMAADLHVSPGSIAFLLSALAFTYTLVAPLLQMAIGDWDRRRLIILGLVALAAGSLLCALAPNYTVAVWARMFMALGCALIGPMVTAAAASIVPPDRAGQALGVVLLGISFSSVLGLPLVSFLGTLFGWRFAIGGIAGLCLLTILILRATVPTGSRGVRTTPRALLAVAVDPVLAPALLVTYFQMAAQFATYALIGVYLTTVFEAPPSFIPIALLLMGITSISGSALSAHLLGRMSYERLLAVGLCAVALVFLVFPFTPPGPLAFVLLGLWSVVSAMSNAPQSTRLVGLAGEARNLVLTLNAALLQCGLATGAAMAGVAHDRFGVRALPLASLALILIALGMYALSRRSQVRVARLAAGAAQ